MSSTGTVVRFDRRRGYGFVAPDDGGEDLFVHQNNINMEGFRFLQVGEKVTYELEVGEKGMKAVQVALTEPRAERPAGEEFAGDDFGSRDDRDLGRPARAAAPRGRRDDNGNGNGQGNPQLDKLRRKQERLISLLVEKGVLAPGEIDGLDGAPAKAAEGVAAQ